MDLPENYSYFKLSSAESKNKLDKLFDFIKFRKWVIKQIKQDNPQKLILLSTLTGVLLFDQLKKLFGMVWFVFLIFKKIILTS